MNIPLSKVVKKQRHNIANYGLKTNKSCAFQSLKLCLNRCKNKHNYKYAYAQIINLLSNVCNKSDVNTNKGYLEDRSLKL